MYCLKQRFTFVYLEQLSPPPTDERMRRNEEKREGKIRPLDSILGWPWLHLGWPLLHLGEALATVFTLDLLEICKNQGWIMQLITFNLTENNIHSKLPGIIDLMIINHILSILLTESKIFFLQDLMRTYN